MPHRVHGGLRVINIFIWVVDFVRAAHFMYKRTVNDHLLMISSAARGERGEGWGGLTPEDDACNKIYS